MMTDPISDMLTRIRNANRIERPVVDMPATRFKANVARVLKDEETLYLASGNGHVIQFAVSEINVLSGAGKGVMGIKLEDGDTCLGGALMGGRFDKIVLETSGGKTMEFGRGKYEVTSRGGKGIEAVKRTNFVRGHNST